MLRTTLLLLVTINMIGCTSGRDRESERLTGQLRSLNSQLNQLNANVLENKRNIEALNQRTTRNEGNISHIRSKTDNLHIQKRGGFVTVTPKVPSATVRIK